MLEAPGLRGLAALPLTVGGGVAFGWYAVRRMGGLHPLGKVAIHAIMLCVMAAFFWAWAAYKLLVNHDPDLGVVSFLIAFVAAYRTADLCAVQISRSSSRSKDPTPVLRMQTWLPVACFVPMINYLVVLCVDPTFPFTFQLYLMAGSATWSICALRGGWLLGDDVVTSTLRDNFRRRPRRDERQGLCHGKPDEEMRG
jgi:hypothetical protein